MIRLELALKKRPREASTSGAMADHLQGGVDMSERTCSVDDCHRSSRARGWCLPHYKRWRRYGDPTLVAKDVRVPTICSIDGCERRAHARSLCHMHYSRWRRTGDPTETQWNAPLVDRLIKQIDASGDCWEWTGNVNNGYGRLVYLGRDIYAHRAVWEELVGTIPDELEIDHLCRNTICVNPDHLEPVTHAENVRRGSRW